MTNADSGEETIVNGITSSSSDNLIEALQNPQMALAIIEQLQGGSALRAPLDKLEEMLDALLRGVPYVGYRVPQAFNFFRARIDNNCEYFDDVSAFKYRPVELSTDFGRCHKPGQTIFYASWNLDTVLNELTPEIGDRIHVGVCSIKLDQEFLVSVIGGLDHARRFQRSMLTGGIPEEYNTIMSQMNPEQQLRTLLTDAFFADLFLKPATRQRDRKATSILSDLIINMQDQQGNFILDGFAYPSVAHRGGLNFAVRPESFDRKMEWHHFMVFNVQDYVGFGLYGREQLLFGEPEENGTIRWKSIQS